ncbi:MAG: hypothetical protein JW755_04775 [Candidatus Aminicenantes bacterium]|nr:hypothetical protein [Candidatus Aminicenantes bacterium]
MIITAVIHNNKRLESYLEELPIGDKGKYKYVMFGENDPEAVCLLEKKGFQEITPPKHDHLYRDHFLQEYIDLVGLMGKEPSTPKWWATNIASKNRFTSKLPLLLQQFLSSVKIIKEEEFDHLIILNPSWVILDSLRKVLRNQPLRLVYLGNPSRKWKELISSWCRVILLAFYTTFIILGRKYWVQKKLKPIMRDNLSRVQPYYVVKTFIYDHSFSESGAYRDVFFGSLLDYLKEKRQVLVYANILGNYKYCMNKIAQCSSHVILPIEAFLSSTDILGALFQFLFCKIRTRRKALFWGYDVTDIINNEFFRTYNGIDLYQFLHYWSTKKLLQTLPVEIFLLTYENNPWEKMCMMALREYSPNTTVIGYQHTVVPQASANMFIGENEKDVIPMPDRVLTVGEAPKEIMERYGSYEKGRIGTSCGLRFEYLFHASTSPRKRSGHILLVLEGIFEVYKMVNYVLRELKGKSQYRVTIRTHPVLPLGLFQHKLTHPLKEVSNFALSNHRLLKDDIDWADIVIYWGSTVALEALSMGTPVIHYESDSILSYDPLFECSHLKWVLSEKEPLIPTLDEIYSLSNERFGEERMKAKEYLSRYFHPVTEDEFKKFLVKS